DTGVCPFGLCFRPAADHVGKPPFSTWEYRPPYLPEPLSLAVGTNAAVVSEPFLCYLPFVRRPDNALSSRRQPLDHAVGLREVTHVTLECPQAVGPSPALRQVMRTELIDCRPGEAPLVELGFDGVTAGRTRDFRPELPLILRS